MSVKQFVCNSPCKVDRKIFYPEDKIYLVDEFNQAMFDYECVSLAIGKWQGNTSKSYFVKHFNFVCQTDEPYLSKDIVNQIEGVNNE